MADNLASLDLGTNTFRLLIGQPEGGGVRRLVVQNRITRLGQNLEAGSPLYPQAAERALAALAEFRSLMDARGVVRHRAVGTSALRVATDSAAFIGRVRERVGIKVDVIAGQEEARLTSAGMLWSVGAWGRRVVTFDIGGGSTEFGFLEEGRQVAWRSLEVGVVELTERLLSSDPPGAEEVARLREAAAAGLAEAAEVGREVFGTAPVDALIATAGTPTTLAAMMLGLRRYDPGRVNGYVLHRGAVEGLLERLAGMRAAERLRLPGLEEGREDLIVAGICIVLGAMLSFKASKVVVSDGGLLEGVFLDLLEHPAKGASLSPAAAFRSHK